VALSLWSRVPALVASLKRAKRCPLWGREYKLVIKLGHLAIITHFCSMIKYLFCCQISKCQMLFLWFNL
jgi:hypothetical protein